MIIKSKELLSQLNKLVTSHIEYAKYLKTITKEELQRKSSSKSWSVTECIEHLNLYAAFYNLEIARRMEKSSLKNSENFKSGYLGNKFANDMLPKDTMKTMQTFKSKNPIYSKLGKDLVLTNFITLQEELLDLLNIAQNKNLTRIKTSITLPLLKFRLGDTFRFVIYHNERHIVQAKKNIG